MKNLTFEEGYWRFRGGIEWAKFAWLYKSKRECYAALLRGEAGEKSLFWAIYEAIRMGFVMPERDRRLFAARCARRVQHLMTDERSIHALDVAERHANGDATDEELSEAEKLVEAVPWMTGNWTLASDAAYMAVFASPYLAAQTAAYAAASAVADMDADAEAWSAAFAAEREAQLAILAQFGNPFEEVEK